MFDRLTAVLNGLAPGKPVPRFKYVVEADSEVRTFSSIEMAVAFAGSEQGKGKSVRVLEMPK